MEIDLPNYSDGFFDGEDYRNYCFWGGRGGGKSHTIAQILLILGRQKPLRILCAREVQKSLKDSVMQLLLDYIKKFGWEDFYTDTLSEIRGANGTKFIFAGLSTTTTDQIKSFEGVDICWIEEAQSISDRSVEILVPTIRKKGSFFIWSWNPRHSTDPVDIRFRGDFVPDKTYVQKVNYDDNPWFPEELRQEMEFDRKSKPDRFAHIWLGEYEPQAVGAIWTRQVIKENRVSEAPELERIVVAVDPAISNEANSDKHGITVEGIGSNKHGYLLEDGSLKGSPEQWAQRAVALYDKWDADAIVVEINQGGDMVKHTLKTVRPNIRIVEVRATKGKHVRAEPISALYHLGQIHHVGSFPEIEAQMCLTTPAGYDGDGSPDEMDSVVWGFTELFPKIVNRAKKKTVKVNIPQQGGWMN